MENNEVLSYLCKHSVFFLFILNDICVEESQQSALGFVHHSSEVHPFLPAVSDHPGEIRHLLDTITKNVFKLHGLLLCLICQASFQGFNMPYVPRFEILT